MSEKWLPIPGYEGTYEVSDQGRVRSLTRAVRWRSGGIRTLPGRLLALIPTAGYRAVNLCGAGGSRIVRVHRLVLLAFVGPPGVGQEVCHGNGQRDDNRLANLRWGSRSDNLRDAVAHGTHHSAAKTHCPLGHPLQDPNLAQWTLPHRRCLTCHKARRKRNAA